MTVFSSLRAWTKLDWWVPPIGDCKPEDVGLFGVANSSGGIHLEHRPGDRVLSTFSGSDSTLLLGT